jgi:uncharacterized membrane protein
MKIAISIILIILILGSGGAAIYLLNVPNTGDGLTEFYVLGAQGQAENYPTEMKIDAESDITLVIINHESQPETYTIMISMGDEINNSYGPIHLNDGQKWEGKVRLSPHKEGNNQKLELSLLKENQPDKPLTLFLPVNVNR